MSIEAMKQAITTLLNHRWEHYGCEDAWYSCPKHKDGCYNELAGDECNCGADKANLQIDLAIAELNQAIREAEKEQVEFQDFVANVQEVERQACEIINREWVGLTSEEMSLIAADTSDIDQLILVVEDKLREKNAYGWQSVDNLTEYLDELRGGRDDGTNKNICGND